MLKKAIMTLLQSIPFLTPIQSKLFFFTTLASNYLCMGSGKGARLVTLHQGSELKVICKPYEIVESRWKTLFKVSSMILSLGIIPILALLVIASTRSSADFYWEEIQSRPHASDFYENLLRSHDLIVDQYAAHMMALEELGIR